MARYSGTVRDQNQAPVIGALVAVRNQDGTTPILYDDDDLVLDNPLTTDGYGTYYFNVETPGYFDLTFYYGGRTVTKEYGVPVGISVDTFIPLVYDLGERTASTPLTDLSEEWNNAAVEFVGERRSFTGTAYDVNSVMISYEFDGDRKFALSPNGAILQTPGVAATAAASIIQSADLEWNDGLLPGDGGRVSDFHVSETNVDINAVNQILDSGLHTVARWKVNDFSFAEIHPPTAGVFPGGVYPPEFRLYDPLVPAHTSFGGLRYNAGILGLTQGIDINGFPNPVIRVYWDDFNGTSGSSTALIESNASNRLQIQALFASIVHRNGNGRYEWESSGPQLRITFVGYELSAGKPLDVSNSGQVSGEARVPFTVSTVTTAVDTQVWSSLAAGVYTNRAKVTGLGHAFFRSLCIGADVGAVVTTGAQGATPVTNNDLILERTSASWLKANNGAGGFANVQGKLTTETGYTGGATAPTGYLVLYDAAGTAYKVPAELL